MKGTLVIDYDVDAVAWALEYHVGTETAVKDDVEAAVQSALNGMPIPVGVVKIRTSTAKIR